MFDRIQFSCSIINYIIDDINCNPETFMSSSYEIAAIDKHAQVLAAPPLFPQKAPPASSCKTDDNDLPVLFPPEQTPRVAPLASSCLSSSSSLPFSNPKQQRRAILQGQVQLALDVLERHVTAEYRQALEQVPYLVQTESKMWHFLQAEDYSPARAATRLALYWKVRHE